MADKIQIKDRVIRVDTFEWQEGSLGKKFRLSGTRKNLQIQEKYINGTFKWHWIYTFFYEDLSYFEIEIGYDDKFIRKL